MTKQRIYAMSVANVYPLYVAKAEKKERTKAEVDEIIRCYLDKLVDELARNSNGERVQGYLSGGGYYAGKLNRSCGGRRS